MSVRTSRPVAPSPFDIVRRCCLQQAGLPFAEALTAGQMEQASEAVGVSFGRDPQAVYTPPQHPVGVAAALRPGLRGMAVPSELRRPPANADDHLALGRDTRARESRRRGPDTAIKM